MKKLSVLSIVLICLANVAICYSQENCDNSLFNELSIKKITSKKERRFIINFNYQMSESLQESVFSSSILRIEEKPIVMKGLGSHDFIPCEKVNDMISQLETKPLYKNKTYILLKYSKPIFVNDKKVLLFHEIVMKKDKLSDIKGGANCMEVFIKVNNSWTLTEKKILETY